MKPNLFPFFLLYVLILSCDEDKSNISDNGSNTIDLTENVEVYKTDLIHDNLTLAVVNGSQTSFLVNKQGQKVYSWEFEDRLGNDLEILPDGRLLGIFKDENAEITFGGYGGIIKIINPDNSIAWEFNYSSTDFIAHHDVEMLPNGNVLILVWERINEDEAEQQGAVASQDLFAEKLMEINPNTNEIVWEWRSWDHIIQDGEINKPNYGIINEHPELIHINYNPSNNGDIMHANGLDYDENKDVIYLSVNFYSEVWVIDHSTTITEAASHSGGNYNKGGDLLYRFGNPLAYDNNFGEVRSSSNHFPNLLEDGVPGEGNILIFINGLVDSKSKVLELEMPENFNLLPNVDNEPSVVWSFSNDDFFANKISGAVRLSNGNTLICEGDYGFWEISPQNEIVWKYNGDDTNYWRCYDYNTDSSALSFYDIQ